MCYYKPNQPPCTCSFLQLIQPCSNVRIYPAPSPTQNPHPLIRVCTNRYIARGVGQRFCAQCSAAPASTTSWFGVARGNTNSAENAPAEFLKTRTRTDMDPSLGVEIGKGKGRMANTTTTTTTTTTCNTGFSPLPSTRYTSGTQIQRKIQSMLSRPTRMASPLSSSVLAAESGGGTSPQTRMATETEGAPCARKGSIAHMLSGEDVSVEQKVGGTHTLNESDSGSGDIVKVDRDERIDNVVGAEDGQ
ncbi:hypothetical protein P175DRAFT_0530983 [Aspergillus ochraceoroseus IBT 24754]|uniref:Uncharacterized protein n=1 Tax=Aspergillus ochraceoroseus IBT 24754 TaxID=1392256 RepID=A0A2T5LYX8_9EURO|nr:uncharacterized protein P175DRAFT_0530983 [Aspergillus ochraceoroseus IBT 24754]PTU21476.1 hypothetical protein P175DRAFT_0530983 [Aspergillus ochraceoroseus IBT 24754]